MSRGLSARAHSKVLESATELFAERGIDATSVDAIAAAAGVSKATIYKHWADKDALCLEVMQYVHEIDGGAPEVDSGDLRADLIAFLKYEPSRKKATIIKKLTPHLIAYSARNEEFGRAWKTRVMDRARSRLKVLLRRGVNRGVFPAVLDEDLGVALLLGPMLYRHIFGSSVSLDWLADGAVDSFWKAHARPVEQTKPSQTKKYPAK
ncbi:MAG TPA: TetR/AcrR family transcriptional regulator [Verrucomicrobiae bacterium]|jgi:AcrR family transcriptional regulator|nr:TetR/AcrR family transcriptional regulator [Verrucomicrobiae bacterium]